MAFDLSNYVTVAERLTAAKEKHPDGRFQSRIVEHGFPGYIVVEARFYRDADDKVPAVGLAWEPVPGKTPYTKDSELQNAETSAWGRALIAALVADASGGVASQEEVRNRQTEPVSRSEAKRIAVQKGEPMPTFDTRKDDGSFPLACPSCGSDVYDNRASNDKRQAEGKKRTPEFKCRRCDWLSWEIDTFEAGGKVDDIFVDAGLEVEDVTPPPLLTQWELLLDMCKVFKAWSSAEQAFQAQRMCDTLGFKSDDLKPNQPAKVFKKLAEVYFAEQPDEAPF